MSTSSSKGMRVLPTKKNARNKKVTEAKPPRQIIRTRRKTRSSSAQKDSDTNINITEKSSLEHPREPTIKETSIITETPTINESIISDTPNKDHDKKSENKVRDDNASQKNKTHKSPDEKEKSIDDVSRVTHTS